MTYQEREELEYTRRDIEAKDRIIKGYQEYTSALKEMIEVLKSYNEQHTATIKGLEKLNELVMDEYNQRYEVILNGVVSDLSSEYYYQNEN